MNEKEFCYWLNGFFELSEVKTLNTKQVQIIKDHLALVFTKITPTYPYPDWTFIPSPFVPPTYTNGDMLDETLPTSTDTKKICSTNTDEKPTLTEVVKNALDNFKRLDNGEKVPLEPVKKKYADVLRDTAEKYKATNFVISC